MRKPVAGVACGLVLETGFQSSEWHRYQILNDLAVRLGPLTSLTIETIVLTGY